MTPKWFQNGAKSDPKTIPESNHKRCRQSASKVRQKGAKNYLKKIMKSEKNVLGPLFFNSKKITFPKLFFLSFYSLREALDPGNQAKTV